MDALMIQDERARTSLALKLIDIDGNGFVTGAAAQFSRTVQNTAPLRPLI